MNRRTSIVVVLASLVCALAGPAGADWMVGSGGLGYGKATSLPSGTTPTASVEGRNVTVSWAKTTLPDGGEVAGYRVRRYDSATGAEAGVVSACDAVVTTLSCTENAVPPGTWRYGISPVEGNWVGSEGTRSSAVTVDAPAMSFSSNTTVTSLPATLNGDLSGFVNGASITFRLDDETDGAVLTSTTNPAAVPTSGAATFSVTLPAETTNGSHTVYAVGTHGDVASAPIDVNVPSPTPTSVQTVNGGGGQTGRANQGDIVRVVYSQALDASSLCSTWSGNLLNQILNLDNVVAVTINDNAAGGNDQLVVAVTGACASNFRFGSIDLGNANFVVGSPVTFSGLGTGKSTIAWDPSTRELTITLGARSLGPNPGRVNANTTATYMPDAGIRNPGGVSITGTAARTAVQF